MVNILPPLLGERISVRGVNRNINFIISFTPPDSEQIERSGAKLRKRNSVSVEEIQDGLGWGSGIKLCQSPSPDWGGEYDKPVSSES